MRGPRVPAPLPAGSGPAGDLEHLEALARRPLGDLLQRATGERSGQQSELHRVTLHPAAFAVGQRDGVGEHVLDVAVAEGRVVRLVRRAAARDVRVDGAVQLAERVREALGVRRGQARARGRRRMHERRVAEQGLVRPVAVPEPELLVALGVPGERARRAVDLEPSEFLRPDRDLRERRPSRARRSRSGRGCARRPRSSSARPRARRRRRSRTSRPRPSAGARTGIAVARSAKTSTIGSPVTNCARSSQCEPMSPTARSSPAALGLEPPVPVGRLRQPVLEIAAVHVPDLSELARADALARLLHERVEAEVEVRAVHEPASSPPARRAPPTARTSIASGFSQTTCLPASSACFTCGWCRWFGVVRWTTSTRSSASSSS